MLSSALLLHMPLSPLLLLLPSSSSTCSPPPSLFRPLRSPPRPSWAARLPFENEPMRFGSSAPSPVLTCLALPSSMCRFPRCSCCCLPLPLLVLLLLSGRSSLSLVLPGWEPCPLTRAYLLSSALLLHMPISPLLLPLPSSTCSPPTLRPLCSPLALLDLALVCAGQTLGVCVGLRWSGIPKMSEREGASPTPLCKPPSLHCSAQLAGLVCLGRRGAPSLGLGALEDPTFTGGGGGRYQ